MIIVFCSLSLFWLNYPVRAIHLKIWMIYDSYLYTSWLSPWTFRCQQNVENFYLFVSQNVALHSLAEMEKFKYLAHVEQELTSDLTFIVYKEFSSWMRLWRKTLHCWTNFKLKWIFNPMEFCLHVKLCIDLGLDWFGGNYWWKSIRSGFLGVP